MKKDLGPAVCGCWIAYVRVYERGMQKGQPTTTTPYTTIRSVLYCVSVAVVRLNVTWARAVQHFLAWSQKPYGFAVVIDTYYILLIA